MSRLIVVGDSHARALALGATALGYDTLSYATSAAVWRDGVVRLRADGTLASERPRARANIAAFSKEVGAENPLTSGAPVVASVGYHASQFQTDMRMAKLGLTAASSKSAQSLLSPAFLAAWLKEARDEALEGLATIAAAAPLVVVTPPMFQPNPLLAALNEALSALIRAHGLPLYDPNTALAGKDGTLPHKFAHDDAKHGNAAFGTAVFKDLLRLKLIAKPKSKK